VRAYALAADDGPLLQQRALAAGCPAEAVRLVSVADGPFGVHCGCLLPPALVGGSRAVRDALAATAHFVCAALERE
jgi:hypothetical protein